MDPAAIEAWLADLAKQAKGAKGFRGSKNLTMHQDIASSYLNDAAYEMTIIRIDFEGKKTLDVPQSLLSLMTDIGSINVLDEIEFRPSEYSEMLPSMYSSFDSKTNYTILDAVSFIVQNYPNSSRVFNSAKNVMGVLRRQANRTKLIKKQMEFTKVEKEIRNGEIVEQFRINFDELNKKSVASIVRARQIAPGQQIAPAKFDVKNDRLVVLQEQDEIEDVDSENIKAVRSLLVSEGELLTDLLLSSNCDRRVTQLITNLRQEIFSEANIIRIGVLNQQCLRFAEDLGAELSDFLSIKLKSYCATVDMFASQFPDWRRFIENVNLAKITEGDVRGIISAADQIIDKLEGEPHIADPAVPKTIAYLRSFLDDPKKTSKRTAYAVLRTLENLIGKAWQFVSDLLIKIATQSIEKIADHAIRVIVIGVMGLAGVGVAGLTPLAASLPEVAWVKQIGRYLEKNLSDLAEK